MYKKFTLFFLALFCIASAGMAQSMEAHPGITNDPPEKVVKAYPVPATTQINFEIQHNNEGVYEIIVFNFLGKKMDDLKGVSSRTTLNLDKYYSGIYIYQLRDNRGTLIESGKFNVIKR